jgi:hypothetical protein
MNEVSIIINGVRYDAVGNNELALGTCQCCDLLDMCKAHCNFNLCEQLGMNFDYCFKKSDKKFEP